MSADRLDEPMTCDVCGSRHTKKIEAGKIGWEWFTGYLPKTFHCCPKCAGGSEYKKRYNASQIKETGE